MDTNTSFMQIVREDGVRDLAMTIRVKFGHALEMERLGNDAQASIFLAEAIEAEVKVKAETK